MDWLRGKKTIITAVVYALAALVNELGVFFVPEYMFQILASIGLITLRLGIKDA